MQIFIASTVIRVFVLVQELFNSLTFTGLQLLLNLSLLILYVMGREMVCINLAIYWPSLGLHHNIVTLLTLDIDLKM